MYSNQEIEKFTHISAFVEDLDAFKVFFNQDPKLAGALEQFNAIFLVIEGVSALLASGQAPTYLNLVKYFTEHVLQNGLLAGVAEKNLKDIVPLAIKQGYVATKKAEESSVFVVTEAGDQLFQIRKQIDLSLRTQILNTTKH